MSEESMTHEPKRHPIDFGGQGRRAGGYSLRKALENQGVTTEEETRLNLNKVYAMLQRKPTLDITRYRSK